MRLTVDHVPFAWHDLDEIVDEFEALGLTPEYGGVHDNGVTHMSVLGFDDRSYVELIAEREPGEHDFWPEHIRGDAGPAAWCIRVADIVDECHRLLSHGVTVDGPTYGSRRRDDGTLVEWDIARFGPPDRRHVYPFAIEDRTPLAHRVTPSPSVAEGPVSGIGQVVIAVDDVDAAVRLFREQYRFPRPVRGQVPGFGTVASFPGRPVALADGTDVPWLANRRDRLPEGPCACLLSATDLEDAMTAYPVSDPTTWPDGQVAFFHSDKLGYRLGLIGRENR